MIFDIEKLRKDMLNKYGTAMFSGLPMAIINLSDIERASDDELIKMAKKENIDLDKYIK